MLTTDDDDDDDSINFGYAAERYPGLRLRPAVYSNFLPRVRGLAFHEPSRRMLVASMSGRNDDICIRHFTPSSAASADGAGPTWVLDDGMCSPTRNTYIKAATHH